jgi:uncharacterized protein (DUF433 family)
MVLHQAHQVPATKPVFRQIASECNVSVERKHNPIKFILSTARLVTRNREAMRSWSIGIRTDHRFTADCFLLRPLIPGLSAFVNTRWVATMPRRASLTARGPEIPWLMSASLLSRITINPEICHGKPVIRNLRYPVEAMLEYLAAGDTIDDLLAEFPDLEREDLLACLEFAAMSLKVKSQHLVLA